MPLVSVVVVLIVVGLLLYGVNNLLPLDAKIRQVINIVVIVAVVLWVLSLFVGTDLNAIRVGR